MKCPVDQADLLMTEREGVEIDYCPRCRGVWLDRGELDKIIERMASGDPYRRSAAEQRPPTEEYRPYGDPRLRRYDDDDDDDDRRYRGDDYRYRGRRRRGWLDDIFDFG